jgi:hypothetical protein
MPSVMIPRRSTPAPLAASSAPTIDEDHQEHQENIDERREVHLGACAQHLGPHDRVGAQVFVGV